MLLFDTPIQAPAVPPKVYPIQWIRNLQVTAHDPNAEGKLYVEILPMSQDRELFWGNGSIEVSTDKLFQAMAEVPEVAQAFGAILNCIKPLQDWIAAQQQTVTPETPTE